MLAINRSNQLQPVVVGVRDRQKEDQKAEEVGVIVPAGLVQHKQVGVAAQVQKTTQFVAEAQNNAHISCD